jgi:reductive dehalogenase
MDSLAQPLSAILLAAAFVLAVFGVVGVVERERRAATLSFAIALAVSLVGLGLFWLPVVVSSWIGLAGWLGVAAGLLYLIASPARRVASNGRPSGRIDEREIMFARARLAPGSDEFEEYYKQHPEHLKSDTRFRRLPGLLSPRAKLAEPVAFASAETSFSKAESMREAVDGPVADARRGISPPAATRELKQRVLEWGARDAGATRLRDYHVYSHVGRGTGVWGEPIEFQESWALAFSVEMDHQIMRSAPAAPVVAESARRYVQAARIAVDLAELIRSWGYPARAHIDGNYRVIAPLVAADAGLGEIGRMGILMTPRLGPRVRLGVVTTSLPLSPDGPGDNPATLDFCTICQKCADNCPPKAIPSGNREPVDSGLRWQLDSDACFRYWSAVGTDCGRCMTVCPFSHPDNFAHNLVRWLIRTSPGARRPLLWADDLFYGRRPPQQVPGIGG